MDDQNSRRDFLKAVTALGASVVPAAAGAAYFIDRAAIAETNRSCVSRYGNKFDELDSQQREQVLAGLENGAVALETVSAQLFFGML